MVLEALGAVRGDEAAVLAWLDCGGRVDATFGEGERSGVTVLMLAAGNGREASVELLLRRGAEVNLQTCKGGTALMYAATHGHAFCCSAARRSTCRTATAGPR